jgi:hypothetical protein
VPVVVHKVPVDQVPPRTIVGSFSATGPVSPTASYAVGGYFVQHRSPASPVLWQQVLTYFEPSLTDKPQRYNVLFKLSLSVASHLPIYHPSHFLAVRSQPWLGLKSDARATSVLSNELLPLIAVANLTITPFGLETPRD